MTMKWIAACLLVAAATTVKASDEVLAPGEPPLTRSLADRKVDYWAWLFEVKVDDKQRAELRKLQSAEWARRDDEWKARWVRFLGLWHTAVEAAGADGGRLRTALRKGAQAELGRDGDAVGAYFQARATPAAVPAAMNRPFDPEALQREVLMRRHEARMQTLRAMSDAQAKHHELMMQIIRNLNSGHYEYNPATGRYDRYVPKP
jgi:hypothetical protein